MGSLLWNSAISLQWIQYLTTSIEPREQFNFEGFIIFLTWHLLTHTASGIIECLEEFLARHLVHWFIHAVTLHAARYLRSNSSEAFKAFRNTVSRNLLTP